MNVSKLKTIHVAIIAVVACLAVGALTYFLVISKTNDEIEALTKKETAAQAIVDTEPSVLKAKADAEDRLALAKVRYGHLERAKMPAITLEDRTLGMIALWKEQAENLGPMVKRFANADAKVDFLSDVTIPAAPANPNNISTSMITLPLGTFNVEGSFSNILNHVRRWNKFGRLVQIDGLTLKGYSPHMTGSYSATLYIMPRGAAGPAVDMAGAGGTGGGMMMGSTGGGGIPGMLR